MPICRHRGLFGGKRGLFFGVTKKKEVSKKEKEVSFAVLKKKNEVSCSMYKNPNRPHSWAETQAFFVERERTRCHNRSSRCMETHPSNTTRKYICTYI